MIQDTFIWVRNCILSSTHQVHLDCCKLLVSQFNTLFKEDGGCKMMEDDLLAEIDQKNVSFGK